MAGDNKIEFMAWDHHNKRFCRGSMAIRIDGDLDYDEYSLMQLTALRSTVGEKIYNHMIVKDNYRQHHLVDMFNYRLMYFLSSQSLEIVGDRFQDSELLELCRKTA